MSREYNDTGIRINRGMRRWHKYGNKILAACIAAAAIIAVIAIAAGVSRSGRNSSGTDVTSVSNATTAAAESTTASAAGSETAESSSSGETTESSEAETTTAASDSGKGGTLSDKPEVEEFSSGDFYDDAVFMGDVFVYGIDEYEYIDSSRLYSATFMTAAKAMDLTSDVAAQKPGKIFVMLGFDDDNLTEGQKPEACAESIIELLRELKSQNPSSKIYAVSEIPISEVYNDNGDDYVTQENLDKINAAVKTGAAAEGIGYIDVAQSLKDGNYMSSDYTNDGCHVKKEYYPFILNGIAKLAE